MGKLLNDSEDEEHNLALVCGSALAYLGDSEDVRSPAGAGSNRFLYRTK
jgi:hypothetical protein